MFMCLHKNLPMMSVSASGIFEKKMRGTSEIFGKVEFKF